MEDPETSHLDLQQRIDHAGKLFKMALENFHRYRENLPCLNPEEYGYLSAYADGLVDWVVGNIEWSLVNCRYKVFYNDSERRSLVLKLRRWPVVPGFQLLLYLAVLIALIFAHFCGVMKHLRIKLPLL